MDELQIVILGPLEAHLGDREICIGGRKARTVFATLVLGLNHVVATDTLIFALWGDAPPPTARDTLQSVVSRLRRKLGPDRIDLIDHSYCLRADPESVDAVRFERLLTEADAMVGDDPAAAAELANRALEMWTGTAFGDLADVEFLRPEVRRLEALRLSALEVRLEADVACGRLTSAIASLEAEIAEHPYRERFWYQLVLALARDGRRVEALRACQRLRAELAEVGLEPSADMRELEDMVIREDPEVRSHLHH